MTLFQRYKASRLSRGMLVIGLCASGCGLRGSGFRTTVDDINPALPIIRNMTIIPIV